MLNLYEQKSLRVGAVCGAALACFTWSGQLFAAGFSEIKDEHPKHFNFSVGAKTEFSDNATKTLVDTVDERQDVYDIDLSGAWSASLVAIEADYNFKERVFSESSEPDLSTVEGEATVRVLPDRPFFGSIMHSRRRVLTGPAEIALFGNFDNRDILRGEAGLALSLSSVDTLSFVPYVTNIEFGEDTGLDSERVGGDLRWRRQMSKTNEINVVGAIFESTHEEPERSYDYERWLVGYQVSLRRIRYRVDVGINKIMPELGDNVDGPFYDVSIEYAGNTHQLAFSASQELTDSSMGNGSDGRESSFSIRSASGGNADQIKVEEYEIEYSFHGPCARCEVSANITSTKESYINLIDRDTKEEKGALKLTYKFSPKTTLIFKGGILDTEFRRSTYSDYRETKGEIKLQYKPGKHWVFSLFATIEKRNNDELLNDFHDDYSEKIQGVSIRYRL